MAAKYKLNEKIFQSPEDIGNVPLVGDNAIIVRDKNFSDLMDKYGKETNTQKENEFLKDLNNFFIRNKWRDIDKSDLELLLRYKSKFPLILDPAKSSNVVFRGATISLETVLQLGITKASGKSYYLKGPFPTVSSKRSDAPGLSFSTEIRIAEDFATEKLYTPEVLLRENRVPCIYGLRTNNPKLLFNPDFITNISVHDDEKETILVGNEFKPDGIILYKPSFIIENAMSSSYNFEEQYPLYYELNKMIKNFK